MIKKSLIVFMILVTAIIFTGCNSSVLPSDYPAFNDEGILFELNSDEKEFENKLHYKQLDELKKKYYQCFYNASKQYKTSFEFLGDYDIEELSSVSQAFMFDFPEYYWWNYFTVFEECVTNQQGKEFFYNKLSSGEFFTYVIQEDSKKIEEKGKEIAEIVKSDNDYNTIKNLHDYIIDNTAYNLDSASNQNLRSALLNDESVCAGYSEVFQYIANILGYECYSVSGSTLPTPEDNTLHEWNIIKINGNWYWIDTTWDDVIDVDGKEIGPIYEYFLANDDVFNIDHIPDNTYKYPICDDNSFYFTNEPIMFVSSLDYSVINNAEISWLRTGFHKFGFKVKNEDDYIVLKDYVFNSFADIYSEYMDPYSGINYTLYCDDYSHYLELVFSKY